MEIATIYYKAKDGRIFTDPLECEQYEKTIGILKGSVAAMLQDVENHIQDRNGYVHGLVQVMDGKTSRVWNYVIRCIDDHLEDFVNVKDLREEQRYVASTIEEMFNDFKEVDRDLPCQYFLLLSTNLTFDGSKGNVWTIANWNPNAWNGKEK